MAKKSKSKSDVVASEVKATAVDTSAIHTLTERIDAQARGTVTVPGGTMDKMLSHSATDAVNVAVVMYEQVCKKNVDTGKQQLRDAEQALKSAQETLRKAVTTAVEKALDETLKPWAAAYKSSDLGFHRDIQIVLADGSGKSRTDAAVSCDLYSAKVKSSYGGDTKHHEISLRYSYSFANLGVHGLALEVQKAEEVMNATMRRLADWRARLADLNSVERKARAAITTSVLGSSSEGRVLLAGMVRSVLPALMDGIEAFEPQALTEALGIVISDDKPQ